MDVKFYPKTAEIRNVNSAKLIFKGKSPGYERNTFLRVSKEDENVSFFLSEDMQENGVAMERVQKLLRKKEANTVLICKPDFFKKVIKYSSINIEAHLKYDDQEKIIMYFVNIEHKRGIFLVAYEEWD